MAGKATKRGPVRLRDNKPQGPGWSWKRPSARGDIPAIPAGKFTDIEGQLMIPLGPDEPQAAEEADD